MVPLNDLKRHVDLMHGQYEAALRQVLDRGWLVLGPEVEAFEAEFASWCGVKRCVGVGNGTDALELGLRALGIGYGNRVITVANAGLYSTVAILAAGAEPAYVDVLPESLLISPEAVAQEMAVRRVDAIIVTHLYGRLADIESVLEVAGNAGVPVIEDCAQAHGARRNGRAAGSFGALGCFSFYPTKNLGALGDGGAVVTYSDDQAQRLVQLRQYGWSSKYQAVTAGGRNSRLDELQAAFLRVKLPLVDAWNERRRSIASTYSERISSDHVKVPRKGSQSDYVAHLYVVQVEPVRRDAFRRHLANHEIGSDVHYPVPDFLQDGYRDRFGSIDLPVTARACRSVVTLPCFPELTDEEIQRVIAAVNSW